MSAIKPLRNQQKQRTNIIFRVDDNEKLYYEMLAKKKGLTMTGLIKIAINRYGKQNLEPSLEKLRVKMDSKINVDIEREQLKLDNFYRYLPNNTLRVLKSICHTSLKLNHSLNMDGVNHLIDRSLITYSHYPPENKQVIEKEMQTIQSLKDPDALWEFLCSRYPQEFKKNMRDVEPQKPKFNRRKKNATTNQ